MRIFRKKETYNEQMAREADPAPEPTAEQAQASGKLDEMADDAGWSEMPERGFFGRVLDSRSWSPWWSSDPRPGTQGLRDAIREDDEATEKTKP